MDPGGQFNSVYYRWKHNRWNKAVATFMENKWPWIDLSSGPQRFWHQGKDFEENVSAWGWCREQCEQWEQQLKVWSLPVIHLLLVQPVPNRRRTHAGPWTEGLGTPDLKDSLKHFSDCCLPEVGYADGQNWWKVSQGTNYLFFKERKTLPIIS